MEHAFFEFFEAKPDGRFADNNDEIELLGDSVRLMADNLLHKSSHPIAHDRIADLLACRDAETERFRFMLPGPVHDELAIGERFPVSVDPAEIFALT